MDTSVPSFPKDLTSFDERVDNVSEGIHDLLWKRHRNMMIAVWTLVIVLEVPSIAYVVYELTQNGTPVASIYFATLPIFIPLIPYAYAKKRVQTLFFEQLGQSLGLSYTPSATLDSAIGHLFSMGSTPSITDVLSGTYHGYPMRLYTYTFFTGSGKSRHAHTFSVCELRLPSSLPGFLAIGSKAPWSDTSWDPKGAKPLQLEGDFNRKFNAYAEVGKEIEALQILEPDSMQKLMDSFIAYGFELCENRLNVFTRQAPLTTAGYSEYLSHTDDLLDILLPEIERIMREGTAPAAPSIAPVVAATA